MTGLPTPFFLDHPSYNSDPHPHLTLPEPFSAYCLTPYYQPDKPDLIRLYGHDDYIAFIGIKDRDDPQFLKIMDLIHGFMNKDHAFNFIVIRETKLVEGWVDEVDIPPMIGSLAFDRNPMRDLPVGFREGMKEKEKGLSDREGNWMATGIIIDPAWAGKGIITAAYKFALEEWYFKYLSPPPGHMAAGWDTNNKTSRRLHERVGFEIMGKRPDEEGRAGTVISIWQGAGRVRKEDTIYRDNENFTYDD